MDARSDDAATGPVVDRRRPTMRDVARHAGVSLKTVSRVVNGESGVSAALAERVRVAVDDLGFRPNAGASNLRRSGGKTGTVGLLLQDVAAPFSAALQRAVEDVARPRGVLVFSASLDEDPRRERELTHAMTVRRADGLILAPAGDDQGYLEPELRAGTAIVCVDRPAVGLPVDSVVTSNAAGAGDAVRHLLAAGHRRIGYLGPPLTVYPARERQRGYAEALALAGLPVDDRDVVHDLVDTAAAEAATRALLTADDPPQALFCAQQLVTIGAVRAVHRLGLAWEVAVVGFDDVVLADVLDPAVTVIAQDPPAIGRTAASVLFARLAGDRSPARRHVVPTTLLARGSGEIPPRR